MTCHSHTQITEQSALAFQTQSKFTEVLYYW